MQYSPQILHCISEHVEELILSHHQYSQKPVSQHLNIKRMLRMPHAT